MEVPYEAVKVTGTEAAREEVGDHGARDLATPDPPVRFPNMHVVSEASRPLRPPAPR